MELFDVPFENAAAQVTGLDGMAGLPVGVFAHVEKHGGWIGGEPGSGLFDGDLLDQGAHGLHDLEKAG